MMTKYMNKKLLHGLLGVALGTTMLVSLATLVSVLRLDVGGDPLAGGRTQLDIRTAMFSPAATSTPTADLIVLASSTGKIADGWIGDNVKKKFGGDGSDGALSVTGGTTTTIDLASSTLVIKDYTSINIAGVLDFSTSPTTGSLIVLRSQGDCTISGNIDLTEMGSAAGVGGPINNDGTSGSSTTYILDNTVNFAAFGSKGVADGGGTEGANSPIWGNGGLFTDAGNKLSRKSVIVSPGLGGGGGGSGVTVAGEAGGDGGDGGAAGGAMILECAGALNFTGTITADGSDADDGTDGTTGASTTNSGGGGGGGGAGGQVVILYNTLTSASGTITTTGGDGGDGGDGYDNNTSNTVARGGGGAAGGSSPISDGGEGGEGGNINGRVGVAATTGGAGGAGGTASSNEGGGGSGGGGGADGFSLVSENLWF